MLLGLAVLALPAGAVQIVAGPYLQQPAETSSRNGWNRRSGPMRSRKRRFA